MSHTETEIPAPVLCDFDPCKVDKVQAQYDGATAMGPWGFMCESHFQQYGMGLGLGIGQRLIVKQ